MIRTLTAATILLAFAAPVSASGDPKIYARGYVWGASHIVVTDSTGKVVEVWKGDLKVGDVLPVDEKTWRLRLPQVVRHGGYVGGDIEGKKVHADRVILFLSKV